MGLAAWIGSTKEHMIFRSVDVNFNHIPEEFLVFHFFRRPRLEQDQNTIKRGPRKCTLGDRKTYIVPDGAMELFDCLPEPELPSPRLRANCGSFNPQNH